MIKLREYKLDTKDPKKKEAVYKAIYKDPRFKDAKGTVCVRLEFENGTIWLEPDFK